MSCIVQNGAERRLFSVWVFSAAGFFMLCDVCGCRVGTAVSNEDAVRTLLEAWDGRSDPNLGHHEPSKSHGRAKR
ncbi:hypothetical protein QBC44DRAFT_17189 [Cladorrhinum sp. PSN332]|nr:hypothetical protein QBC44DRAFT_17189 [Cladorrhinum sp. PSN332]